MSAEATPYHVPVLLKPSVEGLNIRPDGVYVDVTFGGGGHSREILSRLGPDGRLLAFDQDEDAERNIVNDPRLTFVRSNFRYLHNFLRYHGVEQADGILADLGVSSHHLDDGGRGFSFRFDGLLDMRMNKRAGTTAADVVNEYSKEELTRILRDYGEERFAGKIAEKIVKAREDHRIETTDELVELIKAAIPVKMRTGGGHPAKRTFQAIRIEVNQELQVLQDSIDTMIGLLKPGGRLAIITFHSLEDRIVKNGFRTNEHPCICPPDFPVCVCGRKSRGTVVTKKPVVPSTEELAENHRSKSAKLRVFQRAEDET